MGTKYEYQSTDEKFVNPYHFVPLEEECKREIDYENLENERGLKTGWIECELETMSPVFIPNTANKDFFKERKYVKGKEIPINSYDFFSYDNSQETQNPVIPGSSIRGTIRSAFEALTNSCMSTTDDDHVLYKRVPSPAKPGRLVKNGNKWEIIECEKYRLKTKQCEANNSRIFNIDEFTDGQEIYFQPSGKNEKGSTRRGVREISKNKKQKCHKIGYLHKGEPFQNKHHESIFVETGNRISIDETNVINLLENYKLYQDGTVNLDKKKQHDENVNSDKKERHEGYESNIPNAKYSDINELNRTLIYYVKHNGKYYLSPAAIGREVFHNRLKDLIGSYSPCDSTKHLCPACALFGFVSANSSISSRVRFTDGKTENAKFIDSVILPELAGPKSSATEFYLKKPLSGASMWNYDYAYKKEGRKYIDIKGYKSEIQGRKFYWHHKEMKSFDNENERFSEKIPYSERLVKVRPVDKGVKFKFKVYYSNVREDELKRLVWTLSLGNKESLAHKIGMGKPVGLGSIKITINKVKERIVKMNNNHLDYSIQDREIDLDDSALICSKEVQNSFEKIFEYKKCQENIRYPYCIDEKDAIIAENYEWFVGNKRYDENGTGTDPKISFSLNSVNDGNVELPVIKKMPKGDNRKSNFPINSNKKLNFNKIGNHRIEKKEKKDQPNSRIELLKSQSNAKKFKKALTKLENNDLNEVEIEEIERIMKKRPDYKQKDNNFGVQEYIKEFERLKKK